VPADQLIPWFIATAPFTPEDEKRWDDYIKWSGLTQLVEVVSLDPMLCPSVLPELKDDYWHHIVNEDFTLDFFLEFEYLSQEVKQIKRMISCVCFVIHLGSQKHSRLPTLSFSVTTSSTSRTQRVSLRIAAGFQKHSKIPNSQ
jgi:hypothetical protein